MEVCIYIGKVYIMYCNRDDECVSIFLIARLFQPCVSMHRKHTEGGGGVDPMSHVDYKKW